MVNYSENQSLAKIYANTVPQTVTGWTTIPVGTHAIGEYSYNTNIRQFDEIILVLRNYSSQYVEYEYVHILTPFNGMEHNNHYYVSKTAKGVVKVCLTSDTSGNAVINLIENPDVVREIRISKRNLY